MQCVGEYCLWHCTSVVARQSPSVQVYQLVGTAPLMAHLSLHNQAYSRTPAEGYGWPGVAGWGVSSNTTKRRVWLAGRHQTQHNRGKQPRLTIATAHFSFQLFPKKEGKQNCLHFSDCVSPSSDSSAAFLSSLPWLVTPYSLPASSQTDRTVCSPPPPPLNTLTTNRQDC